MESSSGLINTIPNQGVNPTGWSTTKKLIVGTFGILAAAVVIIWVIENTNGPIFKKNLPKVQQPAALQLLQQKLKENSTSHAFFKPTHYDLRLKILLPTNENPTSSHYEGSVAIIMECLEDTDEIILNAAKDMVMLHAVVQEFHSGNKTVEAKGYHQFKEESRGFLRIFLTKTLFKGRLYELSVNFLEVYKQESGFTRREYSFAKGGSYFVYSLISGSSEAHEAFPCFDNAEYKTTFQVTVVRPVYLHSITSTLLRSSKKTEMVYIADRFHETPNISLNRLGVFVSDFTNNAHGKVRVWAPSLQLSKVEFINEMADYILKDLEILFGARYPHGKLDVVTYKNMSRGTSQALGLIGIDEDVLYLCPDSTTEVRVQTATIVAHEIARQWFGELVTVNDSKEELIVQALATFASRYVLNLIKPHWNLYNLDTTMSWMMIMNYMESQKDRTTTVSITANSLQAQKCFHLFGWFHKVLGSKAFSKGISEFLNASSSSTSVSPFKFLLELMQVDGKKFDESSFDLWMNSSSYPIVMVTRGDSQVQIKQSDSQVNVEALSQLWNIPISIFTNDGKSIFHWLTAESDTLNIRLSEYSWITVVSEFDGFFRTNYDKATWRFLIEQLKTEPGTFSSLTRAQLVSDVMTLAEHGVTTYDIALSILEPMVGEKDPEPWLAFFNGIDKLNSKMMLIETYPTWMKFARKIAEHVVDGIGLLPKSNESLSRMRLRPFVTKFSCQYGDESCVEYSNQIFKWIYTPGEFKALMKHHKLDTKLRHILCLSIRHGTHTDFEKLLSVIVGSLEYDMATVSEVLFGLSCTNDFSSLKRIAQIPFNNQGMYKVNTTASIVYEALASQRQGREILLDRFFGDFQAFLNDLTSLNGTAKGKKQAVAQILHHTLKGIYNSEVLSQFHVFVAKNSDLLQDLSLGAEIVKNAEVSRSNVEWTNANGPTVRKWFEDYKRRDAIQER